MPDESNIPNDISKVDIDSSWRDWEAKWQPANRGKLKAKAKDEPDPDTRPCIISPEARYRGAENQLYRVEIHGNGSARDDDGNGDGTVTVIPVAPFRPRSSGRATTVP